MTETKAPSLIVAGGGTGGHVLAGVAIADAWKAAYPGAPVLFVGARGGIEERLVPRAGYPLETLRLGSLNRVSLSTRLLTFLKLPIALLFSAYLLIRARPRAVIGVGGYASGPLVLMARLIGWSWGARIAILEQNAVPGITNRMLARFAHLVLCAFEGIDRQFPGRETRITGNPVRKEMMPLEPAAREPFTIFIFGGSQGALGINALVIEALGSLKDLRPSLRFVHQTGEKDLERVKQGYASMGFEGRIEKFIYDMPECYRAASVVICRSGASTLAELAAVGRASILVPLPTAADNHQEKNARLFVDAGAAELLLQPTSKGADLARLIRELVTQPERLAAMENRVRAFYRPDAARDVVRALADSATHR